MKAADSTAGHTADTAWPSKALAKVLNGKDFWRIARKATSDGLTMRGMEAFAAAEKLAAAVVFRLMAEGETNLNLFDDDVHEAVRFLWKTCPDRRKSDPTKEHLAGIFAWAEANHANGTALVELAETVETASTYAAFRATDEGLVFYGQDKNGNLTKTQVTLTKLELVALTRDHNSEGWGRLVEVTDADRKKKTVSLPAELLAGKGDDARKMLMRLGMAMSGSKGAEELLLKYLRQIVPDRARCVARPGWHPSKIRQTGIYVHPVGVVHMVDDLPELVVLQSDQPPSELFSSRGTLDGWRDNVGRLCVGNSRLVLAVSAALAAPLLHPLGVEGGGIHIVGPSSTGKTTTLHVAGSVCGGGPIGGFVRSWKTTGNGLEATAAEHCDNLLCLDELAHVEARDAAEAAYMLANGQGKVRANRDGSGKRPAAWRLLFLSTGEIGLEAKIAEDPRAGRSKAGQAVRCVEIPADAGAGHGIFETIHGHADGAALSMALREATGRDFGTVLQAFLAALVQQLDRAVDYAGRKIRTFVETNTPAGADGQVSRVAARFGLLAAAGELGVELGVLPWPKGEATRAVKTCFEAWMGQRGGSGPQEIERGIEQVRAFLLRYGLGRFQPLDVLDEIPNYTRDRAGFRDSDGDGQDFYVYPEVWRDEVCAGFDAKAIALELARRSWLRLDKENKTTTPKKLPNLGCKRVVHILPSFLADAEPEGDEGEELPGYPGGNSRVAGG